MTQPGSSPDETARVIVLIYGVMEAGRPFWCFVAVKPGQYQPFLTAQKESRLNLSAFAPFGEVIVAGAGTQPPQEITLKVAQLYQTDPRKFFQPLASEEQVSKAVEEKFQA